MQVREWEPVSGPTADLRTWFDVFSEVISCDLPDEPPWRFDGIQEYLGVTMPEERRVMWFAETDSVVAGSADLLLVGGDSAVLSLVVRPTLRRGGTGQALLTAVAWRAHAEGRRSIAVEVMGDSGVRFYEAHGFRRTMVEVRQLLKLAGVDWDRIREQAGQLTKGYQVRYCPDGPPEEMLPTYARAKLNLRDGPGTDLDADRLVAVEVNRLRASLSTLRRRGLRPHVVVAVHEATDQVAGLTEVVVPAHRPQRADQYDTLVVPAHRGYGLGLAMKARMLLALREAEPQLSDVQTWQTVEMEQMARVNAVLGFVPDREWYEYEVEVPELLARLSR